MDHAAILTWASALVSSGAATALLTKRGRRPRPAAVAAALALAAVPPALATSAALRLQANASAERALERRARIAEIRRYDRWVGIDDVSMACSRLVLSSAEGRTITSLDALRARCGIDAEAIVDEDMARET